MSDFIPNSFQTPNAYIDDYWHLLTPEECKVLMYLARRIFGWNKRADRIALSQLDKGIVNGDGSVVDHGTGLCKAANRRALEVLVQSGLVVQTKPPDFQRRLGACYELELDAAKINRAGLETRLEETRRRSRKRVQPARDATMAERLFGQ